MLVELSLHSDHYVQQALTLSKRILHVQELQGLKSPPAAAVTAPTYSALPGLLVNDVEAQPQVHHAQQGAQISA